MSANSERNLAKLDYLIFLKASVVLVTGWGIDMVHRSINSQLFLLTLKVVISTLVLISAVYSTYFMIFYDWHSPPAFSWIHDSLIGLAPIFPDTFYRFTHYWFAAADIPVANDIPVHCADAIRCNVRRPPQGSLPLLTRQVLA